jgi:hypothetical protein
VTMPGISRAIPISEQAVGLAISAHEGYERRALDELGYPPRRWDLLPHEEQRLRAEAMQELIDAGRIFLMPDCTHPEIARRLVRRELVICEACGLPVTLLRNLAREETA